MKEVLNQASIKPRMFPYQNLVIELHPEVYDPAEDSFLLLESLRINPGDSVLELGTGCGLIALACALKGAEVLCTDINPFAVQLTRRNIERNRPYLIGAVELRKGDLFSVLKKQERRLKSNYKLKYFHKHYCNWLCLTIMSDYF